MIVTFTANPSIDRTIVLDAELARGQVQRAASVVEQAAGKGVNVARVLEAAGLQVNAIGAFADPNYSAAAARMQPPIVMGGVTVDGHYRARVNTAITEPDGTTTKINERGPQLSAAQVEAATAEVVRVVRQEQASWLALSGSLPPGAPHDWYARLAQAVRPIGCRVAIDTSDAALAAVLAGLPQTPFDLIKPNSDELAQLTGGDAAKFEDDAARGELAPIVAAARRLHERGIANVLVTLGGAGAVLVNAAGAWAANAPKISVRSTVGAGDSSVAGFILAAVRGDDPAACLASAVAYGSAAAALPGTTLPTPADLPAETPKVVALGPAR